MLKETPFDFTVLKSLGQCASRDGRHYYIMTQFGHDVKLASNPGCLHGGLVCSSRSRGENICLK